VDLGTSLSRIINMLPLYRLSAERVSGSVKFLLGRLINRLGRNLPRGATMLECVMGHVHKHHPVSPYFHALKKDCPVCGAPLSRVKVTTS
jgi:PII-like signaling protein